MREVTGDEKASTQHGYSTGWNFSKPRNRRLEGSAQINPDRVRRGEENNKACAGEAAGITDLFQRKHSRAATSSSQGKMGKSHSRGCKPARIQQTPLAGITPPELLSKDF